MNSDFEYKKTCQHCGKTFIAQKATTKYCSIQCSRHAFKEQCRNKRLEDEDVNDFLDRIETVDTHRYFLTIDEVRRLHDTPCKDDVVKRASLFSILTGLRMSDILALTWEKFEIYPDGGHCVRLTTEKTDASAYNPVSKEAYEICGTPSTGLVFKSLSKSHINRVLPEWMKDAGINKHITFHCFRHTFATLLVSNGSDIYTVSKMLTHKNVATTQIYADIIDEKKRAAAEIIKIKNNDN